MSDIIEVEVPQVVVIDETNIQIISVAEQGPVGPVGPAPDTFMFSQNVPQNVWVIEHNLDRYPSVTVVDSSGSQIICDVQYDSTDQLTIRFSAAFSGRAYLN